MENMKGGHTSLYLQEEWINRPYGCFRKCLQSLRRTGFFILILKCVHYSSHCDLGGITLPDILSQNG
ncbi:hypothetical protein JTB14_004850 [Gonioctena quinquepunctata]|nr:hypothetical protein JTB14_004850 [Gonioctena quinquepunctata]